MLHWNDKIWKDRDVFLKGVKELMNGHTRWDCEVFNFGWMKLHAFTGEFETDDPKELLETVLPEEDCDYTIFKEGDEIIIKNGIEKYIIRRA